MKADNKITLDTYFLILENQAKERVNNFIEMLYIQAKSEVKRGTSIDVLNEDLIEKFLHKRGYVRNIVLGKPIYIKDFTCVEFDNNVVKVWHDGISKVKHIIDKSILTSLPIALNYFERI